MDYLCLAVWREVARSESGSREQAQEYFWERFGDGFMAKLETEKKKLEGRIRYYDRKAEKHVGEREVRDECSRRRDMAKKELPRISLATVYRNLNQLAQQGEISKLQGIEGKVHFDHNAFEHSHFICHKCKTIIDIPHEAAADLKTAIYEKTGLMADSCQICCKGLCPKCQQRKN